MALERLDKILSSTGRWSRKEIKDMIRHGRVRADGTTVAKSHGGSPLMSKITGCGCSQGGVLAVYACATDPFTAAICGTAVYNVAGTRAAAVADAPASFKVAFIDELYRASAQDIANNQLELEEA